MPYKAVRHLKIESASSVSIDKQEYEKLVRESENLKIVTTLVKNNKYINAPELKAVLGIESEEIKDGIENL